MHGSLMHILGNIFMFILFAGDVEKYLGEKKFIILFLQSGLIGCLSQIIQMYCFGNIENGMIGASAAIYGVSMAIILIEPDKVMKLLFISFKAKYFLGFFFILEIISLLSQNQDSVGHAAHVFGGITGILYVLYIQNQKKLLNL